MEQSHPQPVKRRSRVSNKQENVSSLYNDEKSMDIDSLFSTLRSLLPEPPQKEEESVLVSEVMVYIQKLEKHIQELKKKRADLQLSQVNNKAVKGLQTEQFIGNDVTFLDADGDATASSNFSCRCTSTSPREADGQSSQYFDRSVVLDFFGADLFITVRNNRKNKSTFSEILSLMQEYQLEIIHASISATDGNAFYSLHVKVVNGDTFPKEALQSALHALTSQNL